MSHGLQFQGAYTWSHALDNSVDPLGPAVGAHTFPRNSLNLAQNYGNSDNDTRHVAVLNYIWELPFGRGKSYLSNGAFGKIMEGFEMNGIFHRAIGPPIPGSRNVGHAKDRHCRMGLPSWRSFWSASRLRLFRRAFCPRLWICVHQQPMRFYQSAVGLSLEQRPQPVVWARLLGLGCNPGKEDDYNRTH